MRGQDGSVSGDGNIACDGYVCTGKGLQKPSQEFDGWLWLCAMPEQKVGLDEHVDVFCTEFKIGKWWQAIDKPAR